jgi:hypothetical protein
MRGNGNGLKPRLTAAYERGEWDLRRLFTRREVNTLLRQMAASHSRLSPINHARVHTEAQHERVREQSEAAAEMRRSLTAMWNRLAAAREQRQAARTRRERGRDAVGMVMRRSRELRGRVATERGARQQKLDSPPHIAR